MISQFKRYSPFSCQTVSCDFDTTPTIGKTFDITVPRHGDLVKNMYLRFGINPPTNVPGFLPGFIPSIYMFERFELIIGDNIVETLYPEFINIYYNTFIDFSKKRGNTYNLGPLYANIDTEAQLPDRTDSIFYNTTRTFTVMLPFYFSMQSSQSFPLCALTRQELVVRVYMRPTEYIVQLPVGTLPNSEYLQSLETVSLTHMFMDIEYVFLSNQEFDYFMNTPHYYMYTETQREEHGVNGSTYRLEFVNPVVEFFLYVLSNDKKETNRVDKNSQYSASGHTIASINLTLDGDTYIHEDIADSTFLSQVQYLINHSSVFENNQTTNNMYVYNYSFSSNPEACCPSGTVNFNIIKNKNLKVNFEPVTVETDRTLFVLVRTINMLKIHDGTAEILFKNM